MNLAQKLKRLRELLSDAGALDELEHAKAGLESGPDGVPTDPIEHFRAIVELAQENVAEASAEKRMNRS